MSTPQPFLGNMQTTLIGNVVCLTKYEMEGNKGGSLWVVTPNSGLREDILGDELIKVKIPHAMFEQQLERVKSGDVKFPGVFEILAQVTVGSGNKAGLTALSIRPYIPEPETKTEVKPQIKP
jgi:hypothetical protein